MTTEQYLMMCEQMGWEPNEDEMPKDPGFLPFEAQTALLVFNVLPDRFEGMSGTWMGKDFSALDIVFKIYEVVDRRTVFEYLLLIQREYSDYYSKQQKMRESASKSKGRR
jgi:hypothetical protein